MPQGTVFRSEGQQCYLIGSLKAQSIEIAFDSRKLNKNDIHRLA